MANYRYLNALKNPVEGHTFYMVKKKDIKKLIKRKQIRKLEKQDVTKNKIDLKIKLRLLIIF